MPSPKVMRVYLGFMLLVCVVNLIRVLQDPDAIRYAIQFFAVAIVVAVAVGAMGSVAALILVAVRRLSSR